MTWYAEVLDYEGNQQILKFATLQERNDHVKNMFGAFKISTHDMTKKMKERAEEVKVLEFGSEEKNAKLV